MRTTIEISDPVYKRLKSEAVNRGTRGFSAIVEEALSEYFQSELHRANLASAIAAAEGTWSDDDVAEFERSREQAWSTWQSPQLLDSDVLIDYLRGSGPRTRPRSSARRFARVRVTAVTAFELALGRS